MEHSPIPEQPLTDNPPRPEKPKIIRNREVDKASPAASAREADLIRPDAGLSESAHARHVGERLDLPLPRETENQTRVKGPQRSEIHRLHRSAV